MVHSLNDFPRFSSSTELERTLPLGHIAVLLLLAVVLFDLSHSAESQIQSLRSLLAPSSTTLPPVSPAEIDRVV